MTGGSNGNGHGHSRWATFNPTTFAGVPEGYTQNLLPAHGFVRAYMDYAYEITDANAIFHVPVALSLLSACAPQFLFYPRGRPLYTNCYFALIGPSSFGRKSHSIKLGTDVLTRACNEAGISRVLPGVQGSPEFLQDYLIENPQRLVVLPEGGDFLANSVDGATLARMRPLLTDLFDCSTQMRGTVGKRVEGNKRKKEPGSEPSSAGNNPHAVQTDPRLSLLMGATLAHLESYTMAVDFTGGFLSRFCFTYAAPERDYHDPFTPDAKKVDQLVFWLKRLLLLFKPSGGHLRTPQCMGRTEHAEALWRAWQKECRYAQKTFGPKVSSLVDRGEQHALKIATLLAWDRVMMPLVFAESDAAGTAAMKYLENGFFVDVEDLAPALALADVHIASSLMIADKISETSDGRILRKILGHMEEGQGRIRYATLLQKMDVLKRQLDPALETLRARLQAKIGGMIDQPQDGDYVYDPYRWGSHETNVIYDADLGREARLRLRH